MEKVSKGQYRWPELPEYSREPVSNIMTILNFPDVHGSNTKEKFIFIGNVDE